MPAFCLTVRFLDPVPSFHGRADDGQPEWPPSPLRVFQALVAAAARRWQGSEFATVGHPALKWLEKRAPMVVAPNIQASRTGYRMYVPNNAADLVTSAWARGNADASIAEHRVEKDVRPSRLVGSDSVHYLWELGQTVSEEVSIYLRNLAAASQSITRLGWGIDLVAGRGRVLAAAEVANLGGNTWRPVSTGGTPLRVPVSGTLAALIHRHGKFLQRLGADSFQPVTPLSAFATVGYYSPTAKTAKPVGSQPYVALAVLKPDATGNQSFSTPRRARDVAAWARHATNEVCEGWPFGNTSAFVHGHAHDGKALKGPDADRRFMYLPLPTINHKLDRVESIRRVLITAPSDCKNQVDWLRRRLPGQDLVDEGGEVVGLLNLLPTSDWVLGQYVGRSKVWSTVTPVILPGHDDPDRLRKKLGKRPNSTEQKNLLERLDRRTEALLRKAFLQAGLSPEQVDTIDELAWRRVGFRAGLDLADRYARPANLNGRRYHVRVRFRHEVTGPLAIGAGRYRGLGIFAQENHNQVT